MGNFISLNSWSNLFHYYEHNKRKKVLKGVNSQLNPSVAVTELGHILSQGRKSL